jgi:hypothetical protein
MDTTKESKNQLREGDSWRARAYRAKDETFNFEQETLSEFLKGLPAETSAKISSEIVSLNKPLQELREQPENEEIGQRVLTILGGIAALFKESGFNPPAKTE